MTDTQLMQLALAYLPRNCFQICEQAVMEFPSAMQECFKSEMAVHVAKDVEELEESDMASTVYRAASRAVDTHRLN